MPRKIANAASRVELDGGAIYKYPYMSTWVLDYFLHGKRQRPTLSTDKREAISMAQRILEEKRKAEAADQRCLPGEMAILTVVQRYLRMRRDRLPPESRAEPRSNRTYRVDEDRLDLIVKTLPVEKVKDLTKQACLEFISDQMARPSRTNPKRLVGRTTASKPVLLLVTALRWAASQDMCANPLLGLVVPAARGREVRKRRRAMTTQEWERFKDAVTAHDVECVRMFGPDRVPQAPLYLSIFCSGRRLGEMASLEWPDVLLGADPPSWRFWDTKGRKLSAKDDGEPETYPIPPQVVAQVRALKARHEELLGRRPRHGDRVFVSPEGSPLRPDNVRRTFNRLLGLAGIEKADDRGRTLDLHAARTTVYARAAEAGIPVDQAMEFVGHKDIRTALKHYRDPRAINKRRIAETLARLARGEKPGGAEQKEPVVPAPPSSPPAAVTPAPGNVPQPTPQPASPVVPQPAKPAAEASPPGRRRIPALPPRRRTGVGWRGR